MSELNISEGKEPLVEEGIGLKLEEIRNMLAMKHNMVVSQDDPILVMVSINNAFLAEYQRLFQSHREALGQYMEHETAKHIRAVESLQHQLSHVTVEGLKEASREHLTSLIATKRDLYWISGLVIASALVNVVCLLVRIL